MSVISRKPVPLVRIADVVQNHLPGVERLLFFAPFGGLGCETGKRSKA